MRFVLPGFLVLLHPRGHKQPEKVSLKQNSRPFTLPWMGGQSSVNFVPGDAVFRREKGGFAGCVKTETGNITVWSMGTLVS